MCAGVRTTRSPHPDDGERVLDEEVEDERDDADEGKDRHPDVLPRLRRVQFVLGHVPNNKLQVTIIPISYSYRSIADSQQQLQNHHRPQRSPIIELLIVFLIIYLCNMGRKIEFIIKR